MGDETDLELCRLCLNSGGLLLNIFDEKVKLEFMLEKTIEDILAVKVVEDVNYPWLVCSICTEKLTEFRLFKRRCAECLFVFYNRIQKGCNPARNDWIVNREECSGEIKKEITDGTITSDSVDHGTVDFTDDMIIGKEEIDDASGCSASRLGNVESSMVSSVQEGWSQWSDNIEEGNMFPAEMTEEFDDEEITDDSRMVKVQDDITIVKEEIDTTSEHSGANEEAVELAMVASMKGSNSYYSDNEEAENWDHSEDVELHLSSGKEVDNKETVDVDIPQEKEGLGGNLLQAQDTSKEHDMAGKKPTGNLHHAGQICCKVLQRDTFKDTQRDLFKDHVVHAHLKKGMKFTCDACQDVFEYKKDLASHIKSVHALKKEHQCHHCSRNFQNLSLLKIHMATYSGEKTFNCSLCSKSFAILKYLKRHLLTHQSERPFKCDICSKSFTRQDNLNMHKLIHSGERRHKCVMCSKAFTVKCNLKKHILTHTNEKPFKCINCSKSFTHGSNLNMHMLTHTDERPFKCVICSKSFTQRGNLKKHIMTHSSERLYKCKMCSKSYAREANLKKHMLTHID